MPQSNIRLNDDIHAIIDFCHDGSMDDFITIININPFSELPTMQLRLSDFTNLARLAEKELEKYKGENAG